MKFVLPTVATLLLLSTPAVEAKPGNGRGNGHGPRAEEGSCPPGLAKRDPACIPPGQVGRDDRDDDEDRRDRDDERDEVRDDEDRDEDSREAEARTVTPEPDPVTILLGLLDDVPIRDAAPSDAAALDLPPEPEPALATGPEVIADGSHRAIESVTEAPLAIDGTEIGETFRRATDEGAIGY